MTAETQRLPDFLTVEEAARVLRIGRTAAYGLTREWRATGEGLPVVSFGRLLRVPRAALEAVAGGPLTVPASTPVEDPREAVPPAPPTSTPTHSRHRNRRSRTAPNQTTLFQDPT